MPQFSKALKNVFYLFMSVLNGKNDTASMCRDRGRKTRRLGRGMRKYRKVYEGRGWQRSGITREMKKVDRSTRGCGIRRRERWQRLRKRSMVS